MRIGDREIGLEHPPYVIAEIGVNHDGEVGRALELTDAGADAGADAVKLQYFETDRLMSKAAKLAAYQKAAGETDPIEMLRRLELNLDEMALVVERAHERGIHAIVTVFSVELVERAETLAWDAYKSASPDLVNYPLLRALMKTGKPLIVSTGAASWNEVQFAFHDVLEPHLPNLAMLHCVSSYPTPRDGANIAGLLNLDIDLFYQGGGAGYSDHTQELDAGEKAVRIGATVLEKHLTYDSGAKGPDHSASLEPDAMRQYIELAKSVDPVPFEEVARIALLEDDDFRMRFPDPIYGLPRKVVTDRELDVRRVSRQSVVALIDIEPGTTLTRDMLTIKRPCDHAIFAADIDALVGKTTIGPIRADHPIPHEAISSSDGFVTPAAIEPWDMVPA